MPLHEDEQPHVSGGMHALVLSLLRFYVADLSCFPMSAV